MQIFIKLVREKVAESKVYELNIHPGATIAQLKQQIVSDIDTSISVGQITLLNHTNKPLTVDEATLQDYNVQSNNTLEAQISGGPSYNPQVEPILKQDLISLAKEKAPQFVFITIGSYDNGHLEGVASIKRQQCPDALLMVCKSKGWKLRILLIDDGFIAPPSSKALQIYDVDKDWKLEKEIEKGLVRCYQHKGGDFQLCTYATKVRDNEYGGVEKTLAGVDILKDLAPAVVQNGGCIVVGNFYLATTKPHLALGDKQVLKELGYL
ncbi:MAG TPA: ubiquitin-like domain-containing protein [Ktedonobacteraceae bacterium]|nr:ubiquitin-like domain-containing protein [Ktedonobacteraceae bacterium]